MPRRGDNNEYNSDKPPVLEATIRDAVNAAGFTRDRAAQISMNLLNNKLFVKFLIIEAEKIIEKFITITKLTPYKVVYKSILRFSAGVTRNGVREGFSEYLLLILKDEAETLCFQLPPIEATEDDFVLEVATDLMFARMVMASFQSIPASYQEIIELLEVLNPPLSIVELAEHMKSSRDNADHLKQRSYQRLGKELVEEAKVWEQRLSNILEITYPNQNRAFARDWFVEPAQLAKRKVVRWAFEVFRNPWGHRDEERDEQSAEDRDEQPDEDPWV